VKFKDNIYNILGIVDEKEFNTVINKYNKLSKQKTDFENSIYKKNFNLHSDEYVKKSNRFFERKEDDPKLIAFYLPQFHTIKENDEWWGKGFTEWTNVTKAQPQFVGHYQPHLPDELGFYDLSYTDIFYKQIDLAKKYGIYGFCFHYYWFSGKRLLEKPIFNYLNDKNLDFPFMLCWANEPWSRRWDGSEDDILMPQNFGEEDYVKFIEDIMPFFKDKRYIKIDNKPILIIYRPHLIPKEVMNDAIKIWKDYAKQNGFDGLYLINTRTGGFKAHPSEWGLDATVEFPPNDIALVRQKKLDILNHDFKGHIYNLAKTIEKAENFSSVNYPLYKTVFPTWDNTSRKKNKGTIFYNSSPELYMKWLYNCIIQTRENHPEERQFVFINAWNEWAEGAHLEPDRKYGFAFLEATLDALEEARDNTYKYGLEDHYSPEDDKEENYTKLEKKERKARIKNPYLYLFLKDKGNIKKFWINKRGYGSLKDSKWFDKDYYLKKYPKIKKSGMNPLLHYLCFGYKEGKLPSIQFDGNYYLNVHKDVKKLGFNPLVHYTLYGKNEGRIFKSSFEDYKFAKYSARDINNILLALNSEISIILYIHNDFENTEKCINAILENTNISYNLILIDDFSTDDRIQNLLNNLKSLKNLTIINNSKKLGFLKSVNAAIKNSKGDVVLIKSDVLVTTRWLQKMLVTAYSNEMIGTVVPLLDFNEILSNIIADNLTVQKLELNELVFLVEELSGHLRPEINSPEDSCIYIKREAINDMRLSENGSKTNNCLKALNNDWKNVIDDSTYVYLSSNKNTGYNLEVSLQIKKIVGNIKLKAKNLDITPKKRILFVLHENVYGMPGGTGQTTKDILERLDETFECYTLVSHEKELVLWKREQNQTVMLKSWKIRSRWSAKVFHNNEFKNVYFQILAGLNIDIVHIQHLIGHTFDLPKIAKEMVISVILSFHDFYYICPSIHLLDHDNQYCAGQCTAKKLQCYTYDDKNFDDMPLLKDFIDVWRKEVSALIDNCTSFTAPTESTMNLYMSIYPQLKNKSYKVIEHGRDFKRKSPIFELPSENNPIKILIPGTIKYHKGHEFIKQLKENDHQNRIELHFMGSVYDDLKEKGIYHGKYKREDFCKIVNGIKPSFIGIFSICPETYCHTLTEAWSCGVPVLVTKIGALEERVQKTGGGYLLDPNSPLNAYNEIIKLAESKEKYEEIQKRISNIQFKSLKEMIDEYEQLYLDNLIKN
jgi:glycosyltransferase involved in cell wall biosynthesis